MGTAPQLGAQLPNEAAGPDGYPELRLPEPPAVARPGRFLVDRTCGGVGTVQVASPTVARALGLRRALGARFPFGRGSWSFLWHRPSLDRGRAGGKRQAGRMLGGVSVAALTVAASFAVAASLR